MMIFDLKNSDLYSTKLHQRLEGVTEAYADAFKENVENLSPVRTGLLKKSWIKEKSADGFNVANTTDYAAFVNYGTSKQVGQHFLERAAMLTEANFKKIAEEKLDEIK